jgi:hypothetical protein
LTTHNHLAIVCLRHEEIVMLATNSFPKDYLAACRANIERQLGAYQRLIKAAQGHAPAPSQRSVRSEFDLLFFRNLIVLLDAMFVHRTRAREGKDGNPLNEVRMLCESVLKTSGVLTANSSIKYDPTKTVLGLRIGDDIQVSEADFKRLALAFFSEIETKFA